MSIFHILLSVVGAFILWKILFFLFGGGNFRLIPTNITRTYKTIRDLFHTAYQNDCELLFISGMINASQYIKKDPTFVEKIYWIAENCCNIKGEAERVCAFSQLLMREYLLQDSNQDPRMIQSAIMEKDDFIQKCVKKELSTTRHIHHNSTVLLDRIATARGRFKEYGSTT